MSQEQRVLEFLKRRKVIGVKNHEFPNIGILRYSARLSDLRKKGHHITCERLYKNGKATGTFIYRLTDLDGKDGMEYEATPFYKKWFRSK